MTIIFKEEHAKQARADELKIIESGHGIEKYIEKETFPNGKVGWVLSSKLPFRDKHGRIVGTFGISSDVTRSHRDAAEPGTRAQHPAHPAGQHSGQHLHPRFRRPLRRREPGSGGAGRLR